MDNMAYLQQIAVDNNKNKTPAKKSKFSFLKNFMNIKVGIAALVVSLLIIIICVITSTMNTVDNKDKDLLVQSWWDSNFLIEETLDTYLEELENSDLRNMSASLRSVLFEIRTTQGNLMMTEYGIDVEELDEEKIAMDEQETNSKLNETLYTANLNALLDRVYRREITLQIAYLISYQSEIYERSDNDNIKSAVSVAKENLTNLYNQFESFTDKTN